MGKGIISDLGDSCVAIHPRLVRSLRSLLKTGVFRDRKDKVTGQYRPVACGWQEKRLLLFTSAVSGRASIQFSGHWLGN